MRTKNNKGEERTKLAQVSGDRMQSEEKDCSMYETLISA